MYCYPAFCFFFQAEDGIRDDLVTGVQTCALPISGDVKLVAVFLQGLQKHGGYLQPTLLVHLRRTVAPQLHAPRSTRPRFCLDRTQICGLVWPKCLLSPQIWESVYFAPTPATALYCNPLLTTFDHMISCFRRMSRGNASSCKNRCENQAKSNCMIYAATTCGFHLLLQQHLVVGF